MPNTPQKPNEGVLPKRVRIILPREVCTTPKVTANLLHRAILEAVAELRLKEATGTRRPGRIDGLVSVTGHLREGGMWPGSLPLIPSTLRHSHPIVMTRSSTLTSMSTQKDSCTAIPPPTSTTTAIGAPGGPESEAGTQESEATRGRGSSRDK